MKSNDSGNQPWGIFIGAASQTRLRPPRLRTDRLSLSQSRALLGIDPIALSSQQQSETTIAEPPPLRGELLQHASKIFRKGKTDHWAGDRKQTTVWQIPHKRSETATARKSPSSA